MTVKELLETYHPTFDYPVFIHDSERQRQLRTNTGKMKRNDGLRTNWKNADVLMWNVCDNEIIIIVSSESIKNTSTRSIPISDTNSVLNIEFRGKFTENEISNILNTVAKEIVLQSIYHNDLVSYHWMYDFKSTCGYWIENIRLSDSWREINCVVCDYMKEV